MLNAMFSQAGFGNFRRRPERNQDVNFTMTISLEDAFSGKPVSVKFNTPSGRKIDILVNIPAGVDNGSRIRYQGQGDQRNTSLPPGDLYIQIDIVKHNSFTRNHSTLETKITVDAVDLILGCKRTMICIDTSIVDITIPPGTQHGTKLRIAGKGMPVQPNSKERGDLHVIVLCDIPKISDPNLETLLRQIQNSRGLDNH